VGGTTTPPAAAASEWCGERPGDVAVERGARRSIVAEHMRSEWAASEWVAESRGVSNCLSAYQPSTSTRFLRSINSTWKSNGPNDRPQPQQQKWHLHVSVISALTSYSCIFALSQSFTPYQSQSQVSYFYSVIA